MPETLATATATATVDRLLHHTVGQSTSTESRPPFAHAYELVTKHDLRIWRVRALRELGIVDLLRQPTSTGFPRPASRLPKWERRWQLRR